MLNFRQILIIINRKTIIFTALAVLSTCSIARHAH